MRNQQFWGNTLLIIFLLLHSLVDTKSHELKKPALFEKGLSMLNKGLEEHLPTTKYRIEKWGPGWTNQRCKARTEKANETATKIDTYNVFYDDCSTPWVLCRHTDSPDPLDNLVGNLGRMPVRARSYIKAVLSLPGRKSGVHAYMSNDGLMVLFNSPGKNAQSSMTVFIHEMGHSLDAIAFPEKKLSTSKKWKSAYDQVSTFCLPLCCLTQTKMSFDP